MATRKAKEKERFFEHLSGLNDTTTDEEPEKFDPPIRGWQSRTKRTKAKEEKIESTEPNNRKRQNRGTSKPSQTQDPSSLGRGTSNLVSRRSAPTPSLDPVDVTRADENLTGVNGRRKRNKQRPALSLSKRPSSSKKKIVMVPEARRIFSGQTFYFIPNDNIAGPRKARIEKALQYGAVWERELSTTVTHIIVDSNLNMKEVLRALDVERLPQQYIVVKDTWLTESLTYMEMRIPSASRFQVEGTVDSPAPKRTVVAAEERMVGRAQPPETPSKVDDDTDSTSTTPEPVEWVDRAPSPEPQRPKCKQPEPKTYRYNDELETLINESKKTADLPIDLEDDSSGGVSSGVETDLDDISLQGPPTEKSERKTEKGNSGFVCMQKSDGKDNAGNPNTRTIEVLGQMATYYDNVGDHWRTIAYRKAIGALRKQNDHIVTAERASQIPQIGNRLAAKIEEIVNTDSLRRLESTTTDPNDKLLQLFMGIYGVGYATTAKWIAQGYRSLKQLKSKADLSPSQVIGIEHYHDFSQRIPREEVFKHGEIVRKALQSTDPAFQAIIGGSYRRGNVDSGDIDLIITKVDATVDVIRGVVLGLVVPKLTRRGFLKASLATPRSNGQGSLWHGASALPGSAVWRRIDLLFVPWDELGAALIYFTGNDIFNRSIRLLASKKKMRLNQHGLYHDVMRGQNRERVTDGQLIEGRSERRIFEILGVPWRPAEHRRC